MEETTFRILLKNPPQLLSVGDGVKSLTGFSPEDFQNSRVTLQGQIHREDADITGMLFGSEPECRSGICNLRLRGADERIRCIKAQFSKHPDSVTGEVILTIVMRDARTVVEPSDSSLVANYAGLLERATDFLYLKNRNHVFIASSRGINEFIGANGHGTGIAGKTDYDLHAEQDADRYYRLEKSLFAERQRANEIQQMVAKDGSELWIDNRKYPVFGQNGEVAGIFGIAPDITPYRVAERRLSESEESLREAQKIGGLGSFVLNIPDRMWKFSAELNELLGTGPGQEREFEAIWPLVHPDDRPAMARRFKRYFAGEAKKFNREYRIIRQKDGVTRWVQTRGKLDCDAGGKPLALRGTVQDITDRKQAEEALRTSEESLRQAQKIARLCNYTIDISSGVWEGSETLDSIFGIDPAHPRTCEGWVNVLHPDDRAEFAALLARKIELHNTSLESDYRIIRPSDSALRWIKVMGQIEYSAAGEPTFIHGTIQDITDNKLAELELRRNQELLQLFVEHAPVALAMFDREMRYLAVSRRWADDHSVDEGEILGRSHYEINSDIPERWKETHRRGLAGETQRVEEDRYDRSDGRVQWIRWQIMPWRGEDELVGGIVMFYEDITERKQAEAALRESQELTQLFIDRAPAALAMFDREMRYLAVSRRWLEENSLVDKHILGCSHYEIVPDVPECWKEAHRRGLAGETLKADEDRFERADGVVEWIRWEVVPWRTANGEVGGIVLFTENITAQKHTEERLRQAASVFTHAREGIVITNQNGQILDVNRAFSQITGYSREEVLGQNPRLLKSGLQNDEFYRRMWHSLSESGQWSGEIWNRAKNGDVYPEMLNISAIRDTDGRPLRYVALFSDVTELKNKQRQLEQIAHYDGLTGLPNRVLLADRLRQGMAQANRRKQLVAIAYIDLDGFKEINDRYGHGTGDQLLGLLGPVMGLSLREGDTLARLGGDEFIALLLDLPDCEAALPILRRLLDASSQAVEIGALSLRVSASIGVAYYPQTEEVDADQLLRRADQAMYQAKLAGKNRYHIFDPVQDTSVRERYESLEQIRRALAQSQFVLYYQPKVNMRSGSVVGAEALLRLHHPKQGILLPSTFLPAIEDHPLGIEVGEWVIENALAQAEAWAAVGLDVPVSVNVSSVQLQDPAFVERLQMLLKSHPGVEPSRLELEVLETSALQDVIQTSEVLEACHRMGIEIALDDFGTGYSSLTYLKRLPARVLKIDRSFVGGMLDNPEDMAIVEGVLSLAKAFSRQVIAEGVETAEHGLKLLEMGCELAQGYGIARPMSAAEFHMWMKVWTPDPRWLGAKNLRQGNRLVLPSGAHDTALSENLEVFQP